MNIIFKLWFGLLLTLAIIVAYYVIFFWDIVLENFAFFHCVGIVSTIFVFIAAFYRTNVSVFRILVCIATFGYFLVFSSVLF
jgi:hypothetical protein